MKGHHTPNKSAKGSHPLFGYRGFAVDPCRNGAFFLPGPENDVSFPLGRPEASCSSPSSCTLGRGRLAIVVRGRVAGRTAGSAGLYQTVAQDFSPASNNVT